VGFLTVLMTYGMETALFRFINKQELNRDKVYSTALISVTSTSLAFMLLLGLFAHPIANALEYPNHANYIIWFTAILGFDAITSIPFAKLRADNRPMAFASIKLVNIFVNIGLNLFFILYCKGAYDHGQQNWLAALYNPNIGVGYVFISNLVASSVTMIMLSPQLRYVVKGFDKLIWREMLRYALPLVIVGMAGIVNEMLDRAMLKFMLPYDVKTNLHQLGVYGACYKLATLMSILIQAFRYAAEPFFFAHAAQTNARVLYSRILNYFTIFTAAVFLGVNVYLEIIKHFLRNKAFFEGLHVVPILLMANLFFGIYVNLAIWYKLTDKTKLGAMVSFAGAGITIVLNIIWIPTMGYMGSAWATLIVYFFMAAASYILGRKYYPVPYQVGKIVFYILLALALFYVDKYVTPMVPIHPYVFKTLLMLVFFGVTIFAEQKTPPVEMAVVGA
jgi:O-antigen/teichoic acid export membrane protein